MGMYNPIDRTSLAPQILHQINETFPWTVASQKDEFGKYLAFRNL
jgi:hypothetical protein